MPKPGQHFFFSVKDKIVKILGSAGQIVSVVTTQLCCCSRESATDNVQMHGRGRVPTKQYLHKQADLAHGAVRGGPLAPAKILTVSQRASLKLTLHVSNRRNEKFRAKQISFI